MGLLKEGISEVIATTTFNAAPIGIHCRDGKASLVLFTGSHTSENIARDGWFVANFVHDPVLYVRTAFEDLPHDEFFQQDVAGRTVHRLACAGTWAAFAATVRRKTDEVMVVDLTLEMEVTGTVPFYPVNRGFNSIIDAAVHATRFVMTRDPELGRLIEYHAGIVRKCGGKREQEALDLLMGYIA